MATRKASQISMNSRWADRRFRSDRVATANEPSRKARPNSCNRVSFRLRLKVSQNQDGRDMRSTWNDRRDGAVADVGSGRQPGVLWLIYTAPRSWASANAADRAGPDRA